MVLYTGSSDERAAIEKRLTRGNISFITQEVNEHKINVIFGNPACVDVVRRFAHKSLTDLSPEEDFMLGILLGYDRIMQCIRFENRCNRRNSRP